MLGGGYGAAETAAHGDVVARMSPARHKVLDEVRSERGKKLKYKAADAAQTAVDLLVALRMCTGPESGEDSDRSSEGSDNGLSERLSEMIDGRMAETERISGKLVDPYRLSSTDVRRRPFFRFPLECRGPLLALGTSREMVVASLVKVNGRYPDLDKGPLLPAGPVVELFAVSAYDEDDLASIRGLRAACEAADLPVWYAEHSDPSRTTNAGLYAAGIGLHRPLAAFLSVVLPPIDPRAFVPWFLCAAPAVHIPGLWLTDSPYHPACAVCGARMPAEKVLEVAEECQRNADMGAAALKSVRLGKRVWEKVMRGKWDGHESPDEGVWEGEYDEMLREDAEREEAEEEDYVDSEDEGVW